MRWEKNHRHSVLGEETIAREREDIGYKPKNGTFNSSVYNKPGEDYGPRRSDYHAAHGRVDIENLERDVYMYKAYPTPNLSLCGC